MTKRIQLGLDLRGGTHLILQVQVNDAINVDSDNAIEILKEQLNKKKSLSRTSPARSAEHSRRVSQGRSPESRKDLLDTQRAPP